MAKQDLVVKLLLDSGAFGNDLRQAERRAQQFSSNIQNAGRTAGNLGKELNLATGALGKLGGALTGAGAVVAAVGAFKSIMESSYTTAREFHGVIGGFQGVLSEFQEAIATFDFSNFNNGLLSVFRNAKDAKQAMMDARKVDIGYSYLASGYKKDLKGLEAEYRDKNTTDARRQEISVLAQSTLGEWETTAKNAAASMLNSFLTTMKSEQSNLNRPFMERNAERLLNEALTRFTDTETRDSDLDEWKGIENQLAELTRKKNKYNTRAENWRKVGAGNKAADAQQIADKAQADIDALYAANQELMFYVEAYKFSEEELQRQISNLTKSNQIQTEVSEYKNTVAGWTAGGDATPKAAKGSIKYIQDEIVALEQQRSLLAVNSSAWQKITKNIHDKTVELDELMKKQTAYEDSLKTLEVENVNSVAWIQDEITYLEALRDTLSVGSDEWIQASENIDSYRIELDELLKTQEALLAQYNKTPIPPPAVRNVESISYIEEMIGFYEELRDTLSVGSQEWIEASDCLDSYRVELEELLKLQEAYDEQYKPAEKYEDMNMALSSSISLLYGLGDAFSASESKAGKALGSIMQAMGATAGGIMDFIQIKQAAAAAAGASSAAGMPYPYNLAAIASVVATVLSVFGNIKSMVSGKFAEGGIVGGTSYSGDKLFAMVNSGEMILNKRQQGNLANMIGGGGQVEFHISGDSLVGVLNNKRNKTNLTR
jgi:hypothetical protein